MHVSLPICYTAEVGSGPLVVVVGGASQGAVNSWVAPLSSLTGDTELCVHTHVALPHGPGTQRWTC